ncbi:hypothetical protein BJX62DRAFT_238060 [Aspergillus germanicus]
MPPLNDQRPETDYERWLREQKPDFELGEEPLYDASQGDALGLEKGRESVTRETSSSAVPLPTQAQNVGYSSTPSRLHEPGTMPCSRSAVDCPGWLTPHAYCWIVVSGLMVALLVIVLKRAKMASHRDWPAHRAGHRKLERRTS